MLENDKAVDDVDRIIKEFIENQFDLIKTLHTSDKSNVTLVVDKATGKQYVVKTLRGKRDVYRKLKDLPHPLLPKIIYAAVGDDETVIVEEYINGVSVGLVPFEEKQALDIASQLCDVLAFLHKQGIIHRDIKPSNIIFSDAGTIRLIDFDAARLEKDGAESDTELLGTRGYAAPEQYGFAQTSPRSDIYALGVTMGMLFGEHAKGSKYSRIIAKCTDLNPDRRYKSATEVSAALTTAGKKKPRIIVTAVFVFIVLLCAIVIYGTFRSEHNSDDTPSTASVVEFPTQQPSPDGTIGSVFDNVFTTDYLYTADNMNFVFLDGKSISIDGKTAKMSVDLDGDGVKEEFMISRDHPNGLQLIGMHGILGTNFYYDEWISEIPDAFDDIGDINAGYFAQISCSDLDNDGLKEVLVSVGDKMAEQVTAVYRYTGDPDAPFEYKGYMRASDFIVMTSDKELLAPVGSAGSANIYVYQNGTLTQTQYG